jgi:hypothetical protein
VDVPAAAGEGQADRRREAMAKLKGAIARAMGLRTY